LGEIVMWKHTFGVVNVGKLFVRIVINKVAHGLQIVAELQASMCSQTTSTHARVIPESALVQVPVLERFFGCEPLVRVPAEQLEQQFAGVVIFGYLVD
jgi:hypothetical protein